MMLLPHRPVAFALVGLATLSCATVPSRSARQRRAWRMLAIANGLALIELVVQLRLRLHAIGVADAMAHGLYAGRGHAQTIGMAVAAVLAALAFLPILWRTHRIGREAAIATASTILLWLAIVIEAISLHQIDALLTHRFGPFLGVTLAWAGCAMVTTGAALLARTDRR